MESGDLPGSSIGNKSKKQKLGKREFTNELLDKMITAQENSDKLLLSLEEKRMKTEERQMEIDAQLRREEMNFQFQIMQMAMLQGTPHAEPPPPPHYQFHSTFNNYSDFDPDATQEGL